MRHHTLVSLVIAGAVLTGSGAATAQQPPPIPGETGAIVPEGATGEGVHTIISGTADGIRHLFRRPKKATTPGPETAAPAATDIMSDFKTGTRVIVHYPADGDAGPRQMAGVVTRADREAKTIRIRLSDGTEETLKLLSDGASDVDDAGSDATVYYTDQSGRHVAHYFSRR